MKVDGGRHVVARGDANRPEAIPAGQCSKGAGGYRTRPYTNVYTVERVLKETTEGEGGHETRPYDDTPLVVARGDANRPEAIPAVRGGLDL